MVVDASVWVSRLVAQDVHHAASRHWLKEYVAGGGLVIAPLLLLAEVAGAVSRRTGDPSLGRGVITTLLSLRALRLVPMEPVLGRLAAELAADLGLRGADAVYVATSHHLRVPLVTWDMEQMQRALPRVTVITP